MALELSRFIESDLTEISDYIARHNPTRAVTFIAEIRGEIRRIGKNPFLHRLRPDIGQDLRVAPFGQYLVLFRIVSNVVFIERVVHGARKLPPPR